MREERALSLARQRRLRQVRHEQQMPAMLIRERVNILFAFGAQSMTVFNNRTPARYSAHAQVEHNAALVQSGHSIEEIAAQAWLIPLANRQSCYYAIGHDHGLGMSDEFPNFSHAQPGEPCTLQGGLEAGIVVCIESYVGSAEHQQGAKLENQYLSTDTRHELMMGFEFEAQLETAGGR